jgi:long-chain fatty acid transport protein
MKAGWIGIPAVILVSATAAADDTHYQDFIVGSRAVGLGGAFCAIGDDPSGLYYNPAGIAEIRHTTLQISASLYGFEQGAVGGDTASPIPGVGGSDVNLDAAFSEIIIVPAAFGVAHAFGPEGEDGKRYQSWALSIMVPSYRTYHIVEDTETAGSKTGYSRQMTDHTIWTGAGYGRKLSREFMLGISAFYKLRIIDSLDETSVTGLPDSDGNTPFWVGSSKVKLFNGSLIFNLGARYKLTDRLSIGASVMPPSIPVNSGGSFRYDRGISEPTAAAGDRSRFLRTEIFDLTGDTKVNFQGRIGAAYIVPSTLTVALDVSFFAPVDYTLVNVSDPVLVKALPVVPKVQREFVANVNAGFEYLFVPGFSAAIGAFTDFSSAPGVKADQYGQAAGNQLERVHIFGGTFALGFFSDHTLSRVGVLYAAGSGDAVFPLDKSQWLLGGQTRFDKVEIFRSFLYAFISGTYRF